MTPNPNEQMNTLHLGQYELNRLLEQIDKDRPDEPNTAREFARWAFRVGAVDLTIQHATGSSVTIPVATRNISRGGISILHSAFVHTGSHCSVTLSRPGGKSQVIPGKIARCTLIQGRIHEVGITFDEQISTKDLLGLDPLNEAYSLERVEPDRLHGSVLIVTPTELDRELILAFLDETNLVLNSADTIENAVARAAKDCDLIIADFHLGTETGPELLSALHAAGSDMPVVMMTSDKSEAALDAIRDAHAAGMLTKPISKDRLLQALAEFLHADGDGGPLFSELSQDNSIYPLLAKFLNGLPRMTLNLEKATQDNDLQQCVEICRSLCGTASPLGFPCISDLAEAANTKLTKGDPKDAWAEIRALVVACRRIKAKPAA